MDNFQAMPSRGEIRKAGNILRREDSFSDGERHDALKTFSRWRNLHSYPLNTIGTHFRRKGHKKAGNIVAQRLKRYSSILDKLKRFPSVGLEQMQDIAGIRVIMPSVADVARFYEEISISLDASGHELKVPAKD